MPDPAACHGCLAFDPGDTMAERYGLGSAAMRYIAWNYAVIPLARGGKRPHRMLPVDWSVGARNGIYHATTSPQLVTGWWGQDRAANIGIATGSPGSGTPTASPRG